MRAWHHHGSDMPTSPRAILHHTDPNTPNISGGSVATIQSKMSFSSYKKFLFQMTMNDKMRVNTTVSFILILM